MGLRLRELGFVEHSWQSIKKRHQHFSRIPTAHTFLPHTMSTQKQVHKSANSRLTVPGGSISETMLPLRVEYQPCSNRFGAWRGPKFCVLGARGHRISWVSASGFQGRGGHSEGRAKLFSLRKSSFLKSVWVKFAEP